jgi:hypothetical protein
MKLIELKWTPCLAAYAHTWLANDATEITADFDQDGACGSMILVIATGDTYIKNTAGKWQKFGTTEVIA